MPEPDGKHACVMPRSRGCSRRALVRRFFVAVLLGILVALSPYGVHHENPDNPVVVNIVKSEAHADMYTQALPYLQALADAAGMSVNDFMLTVGIGVGATSGINIFKESASYGADETVTGLHKLTSTLSWPDWDSLSDSKKAKYGNNEDIYTAAQFNSLLGCVGLGDGRDTYYTSGGGNLDTGDSSIAENLGDIGREWAEGAVLDASRVYQSFSSDGLLYNGGAQGTNYGMSYSYNYEVEGLRLVFRTVSANWSLTQNGVTYAITPTNWWLGARNFKYNSSTIGDIALRYGGPDTPNGVVEINSYRESQTEFLIDKVGEKSGGATAWLFPYNNTMYLNSTGGGFGKFNTDDTTASKGAYPFLNRNYEFGYIINGVEISDEDMPSTPNNTMPGTPDEVSEPGTDYQPDGVGAIEMNPDTTYQDITGTPTTPPYEPPSPEDRPQNPYNPSDPENPSYQSGTPEWKQETSENMMPLLNVRLDRLFPFCLVYDLQLLWGRFNGIVLRDGSLAGQTMESFTQLVIPIDIVAPVLGIDIHTTFELDLTPLHDLLLITKPFVFILLVVMLLTSIIAFWKRILTGG